MTQTIFKIKEVTTSSEEVDGIGMSNTMKSISIRNTCFIPANIKISAESFIACFRQGTENEQIFVSAGLNMKFFGIALDGTINSIVQRDISRFVSF